MILSGIGRIMAAFLVVLGLVLAAGAVLAGEKLSAQEIQDEIARYQDLGGRYAPEGFPQLASYTPFAKWRRINTDRLQGKEVYVHDGKVRIWKTMFCGKSGTVFLELSLMNRQGERIPFAWQECRMGCREGGTCGPASGLFIDITGDGRPQIGFQDMNSLGQIKKGFLQNPKFLFDKDILPLWLKRLFPDSRNLATIGPRDSVPAWKDHPLTLKAEEKGAEH